MRERAAHACEVAAAKGVRRAAGNLATGQLAAPQAVPAAEQGRTLTSYWRSCDPAAHCGRGATAPPYVHRYRS
ncbi:hypothetical protein ABIA39_009035 [Nocardia sp. GAS34]